MMHLCSYSMLVILVIVVEGGFVAVVCEFLVLFVIRMVSFLLGFLVFEALVK